ncbi:hypothetical protein [Klenkia taihuensis]|uniref:Uncharacterized protein n=1 Tax=Klenkia taihuensis TaxID=1225127 RepID=A0A1I1S1H8_9ACTN|nr:hypothetical protein [Klenkia taihuensis]GHE13756.1 hypothetical protein GCM10011381_37450 [Klenkia taihuensis]SFD40359.1 hypothetical protein SAMN05661030_3216 [Klenkia taihuensis]
MSTVTGPVAVREPVRLPMAVVLVLVLAGLAVAAGVGLLTDVPAALLWPGLCLLAALVFGAVFVLGAITVSGFAAGAATAGVAALEPGHLPLVLAGTAGAALLCGVAPAWARVEAWQAARSAGPAAPAPRWRTDRVVAAFLVLAFPPVFVTGAVAFVSWTATR